MKKQITLGLIGWLLAAFGGPKAVAQETPVEKKESQEIIIRQKGDKDTKITVEITGDKVLINGKPIAEFNEDGVTVNNRKMIIRDGDHYMLDLDGKKMDLDLKLKELDALKNFNFNFNSDDFNRSDEGGKEYTYLGVNTNKVDDGMEITYLTKEGPAEKAGLQTGDIIYKVDDTKIESSAKLSEVVRAKKDGDKVKVYYIRDGKKKDMKVALGTMKSSKRSYSFSGPDGGMRQFTVPDMPAMPKVYGDGGGNGYNFSYGGTAKRQKLGIRIQDTEESNGVKVIDVEPASPAATAGLMKDDVITEVAGAKVENTDDAREQLRESAEKGTYTIKAKRNGTEMTFTVKIPKKLKTTSL